MNKVAIGHASVLGWAASVGALITSVVESVEHNQALLTGASKPAGILAFAALIATNAMRQFQAAHLNKAAAVAETVAGLPDELAALAREAQANVATAQAEPDRPDGPHVAYAQPDDQVSVSGT